MSRTEIEVAFRSFILHSIYAPFLLYYTLLTLNWNKSAVFSWLELYTRYNREKHRTAGKRCMYMFNSYCRGSIDFYPELCACMDSFDFGICYWCFMPPVFILHHNLIIFNFFKTFTLENSALMIPEHNNKVVTIMKGVLRISRQTFR